MASESIAVRHTSSQSPSEVADWVDKEEPLQKYCADGYHLVKVGDVLGSRYRIDGKLGWGVYSTVWLVHDARTQSYAALKLLTAFATGTPLIHELEYLQRIHNELSLCHDRASVHIIDLLDHFYIEGPNGKHLCLVTELLSEDMYNFSLHWETNRLPVSLVKVITQQVIQGLDFLHNTCNIIHTDIKPANILATIPHGRFRPRLQGAEAYYEHEGPGGDRVIRVKSIPITYPIPSLDPSPDRAWSDFDVKLVDVGVACWADKVDEHFTPLIQSPALRAPEVCIGAGWGKPADIWSLGCTVYEMVMGRSMIKRNAPWEAIPLAHIVLFGDFPRSMVQRGKFSKHYWNIDGSLKQSIPQPLPLALQIQQRGPPPDADVFVDFLGLMFKLDPAKRASCKELLAHPWLSQ